MAQYNIKGPLTDDSLNKINHMFDELYKKYTGAGLDAAEAREKALQAIANSDLAKQIAEQANTTAERVATELGQAILKGDSSPLAGQLKIGADGRIYPDAQQRFVNEMNSVNQQLAQTHGELQQKPDPWEVFLKENQININDFDEQTRQTFLEAQGIDVNYVLGTGNVKPINMSIFRIAGNLFNPNDITDESLINSSGQIVNSSAYNVSDFIRVMVGRNHTLENTRNFAKYDEEENFVGFVDLEAGSNISTHFMDYPLIRASVHDNYLNTARIEEGEDTSDKGPKRDIIPSKFVEKENYPAFIRYKDGAIPYITGQIYSAVGSISLQGFKLDKTYRLRFIARNHSSNGYRFTKWTARNFSFQPRNINF